MGRMLRNLVGVKPDVRNDDLKRYVSDPFSACLGLRVGRGPRDRWVTNVGFSAGADDFGSEPPLAVG